MLTISYTYFINLLLQYLWIPIVIPILFCVFKSFLYVKEVKSSTSPEIEEFKSLYESRIKKNLQICVEEVLQFLGKHRNEAIEHHLYICKKFNKTIGFIKFMFSEQHKYIFIAYAAIDKKDSIAKKYAFSLMLKKIYKKYLKNKKATFVITEIERTSSNSYINGISKLISRYAKKIKKQCYILGFDYYQPSMPDNNFCGSKEEILSLVYIPMYTVANTIISKNILIEILQSIYFEIYYPSCNEITNCNCNYYNIYLDKIINDYKNSLPDYINLIAI